MTIHGPNFFIFLEMPPSRNYRTWGACLPLPIDVGAQSTLGGTTFLPEKYVRKINKTPEFSRFCRGVATGGICVFIPPKSAQVNFLWGKMTSERLFDSFILSQNFYTPKTNFWLRRCDSCQKNHQNMRIFMIFARKKK